jgi:hypothetical protein
MSNGKIIYIFIHVPQQAKGIEFEEETEYKQLIIGFFKQAVRHLTIPFSGFRLFRKSILGPQKIVM